MEIEKAGENTRDNLVNMDTTAPNKSPKGPETKVQVALRVRPPISKEILNKEQPCVQCYPMTGQVAIGKDRTFNFDVVFDESSHQEEVYEKCAKDLVLSCLNGYNTTILAYGQTGSGKTFTMGSSATYNLEQDDVGIIPRVMKEIFVEIEKRKQKSEFLVKVTFLEIYNEEIQDLLDTSNTRLKLNNNIMSKNPITIREEKDGSISVYGVNEEKVGSYEEMAGCLERGSLNRATASTLMNETSSRSHAIFTISIEQHQIEDLYNNGDKQGAPAGEKKSKQQNEDGGFTTAKFHFVDLAGSERLKRTGASGSILREGININRGLLALGNVISALTDDTGRITHVPYRESKLTRMLQDSLGGNSRTVMIACISPSESNYDESLNTLKYASRARNIRNKPVINRDPQSMQISQLKQQVFELQNELMTCKRLMASNMKEAGMSDGHIKSISSLINEGMSAMRHAGPFRDEGNLQEELKNLKIKLCQSEKELVKTRSELQQTKMSLNESNITLFSIQKERNLLKLIQEKYKKILAENNLELDLGEDSQLAEVEHKDLMEEYLTKTEKLKQELKEKELMSQDVHKEYELLLRSSSRDQELLFQKTKMVQSLTSQLKKAQLQIKKLQRENEAHKNPTTTMETENGGKIISVSKHEDTLGSDDEDHMEIQEDEEFEREYEVNTQATKEEMMLVDGTLMEKEDLLHHITQNQLILERNLVDDMKNQYYEKIHHLEEELKTLGKQRDEAISKMNTSLMDHDKNKVIMTYKQKMSDMENKVKEYKQKEREQQNLLKLVNSQRTKIDHLDTEIKKMKVQKQQLHKKMREEMEKFDKIKTARQKELLEVKKKNMEKDNLITKLKAENRRKEVQLKKKSDELLSRCMSKELLRHVQRQNPDPNVPDSSGKKKLAPHLSSNSKSAVKEEVIELLTEPEARELVDFCTEKLMEQVRLSYDIAKEEDNLQATELELENERNKHSELLVSRDKLELERRSVMHDIEMEQTANAKIQELELEINEVSTRVESLEEKLDFQSSKVRSFLHSLQSRPITNPEQVLLSNTRINNSLANSQIVIRCLLGRHIRISFEAMKQNDQVIGLLGEFSELKKKLDETEQRAKFAELQYDINITKLTKEYEKNQLLLMRQPEDENSNPEMPLIDINGLNNTTLHISGNEGPEISQRGMQNSLPGGLQRQIRHRRIHSGADVSTHSRNNSTKMVESPLKNTRRGVESQSDQIKRLEKTISDMTRKQQNSDKTNETLKRKCEILQLKYDQVKKQTAKEKFIGFPVKGEESNSNTISMVSFPNMMDPFYHSGFNHDQLSRNNTTSYSVAMTNGNGTENIAPARESYRAETKPQGSSSEMINSMNLLNFKDKRKEEKQRLKISKHDPFSATNISNENSLSELQPKRNKTGSAAISNTNNKNLTTNSNVSQVFPTLGRKSASASVQKENLNFGGEYDGMYPRDMTGVIFDDNNENEYPAKMDEFFSNEKENIADRSIDENTISKPIDYTNKNWKCCVNIDQAHLGGVYSMVSHGNMLYSSGNKSLKLWSLDRMVCVGELTGNNASIKNMVICPEKNILATACDKIINLWDLTTLQIITTLKGHKDEIKALHFGNDLLFSAGKGSATNGAILTWDIRNANPIDEKEKNQEVFSLASYNSTLYYGCRNHQVRRVNMLTMEPLAPFEPPHYDVVTSLAIVNDHLISGSRDKNLRLWSLDNAAINLKHTSYAHQDWVNTIESNSIHNMVYSGSRDGAIKIWGVTDNKKLRCLTAINGHSSAVSSICKVFDENEAVFATASLDKTIKIWMPVSEDNSDGIGMHAAMKAHTASPGFKQFKPNNYTSEMSPRSLM